VDVQILLFWFFFSVWELTVADTAGGRSVGRWVRDMGRSSCNPYHLTVDRRLFTRPVNWFRCFVSMGTFPGPLAPWNPAALRWLEEDKRKESTGGVGAGEMSQTASRPSPEPVPVWWVGVLGRLTLFYRRKKTSFRDFSRSTFLPESKFVNGDRERCGFVSFFWVIQQEEHQQKRAFKAWSFRPRKQRRRRRQEDAGDGFSSKERVCWVLSSYDLFPCLSKQRKKRKKVVGSRMIRVAGVRVSSRRMMMMRKSPYPVFKPKISTLSSCLPSFFSTN